MEYNGVSGGDVDIQLKEGAHHPVKSNCLELCGQRSVPASDFARLF